jgi:hypothetical protein
MGQHDAGDDRRDAGGVMVFEFALRLREQDDLLDPALEINIAAWAAAFCIATAIGNASRSANR